MTIPGPGQPYTIINQAGQTLYLNPYQGTYTSSRSYGLRMQRGYQRGISQQQARRIVGGYAPGISESQVRREREQARYGDELPPNMPLFQFRFQQRYGYSYNYWRVLRRRYIREINGRAWHRAPSNRMQLAGTQRRDPRVFPSDITAVKQLYDSGFRDPVYSGPDNWQAWAEFRLAERLTAIRAYQDDLSDAESEEVEPGPGYGRARYFQRSDMWLNVLVAASAPPIELWWYH